ncbi:MAG: hypothetical protein H7X92_06945 [Chitinophagales bacterium]|nr:hypothetical protein [Hyphomicrobiales bacterium]
MGSNVLHRDMTLGALSRALYMLQPASARAPQYLFTLLLWSVTRLMRGARETPAITALAFATMEWAAAVVWAVVVMLLVGIFTNDLMTEALVVIGIWAFMLLGTFLAYG